MKKLVAFAMILSLGLFCAIGCSKPAEKKAGTPPAGAAAPAAGDKAAPAAPATPDKAAPETKAPEKK
jgi:hypothetical protein